MDSSYQETRLRFAHWAQQWEQVANFSVWSDADIKLTPKRRGSASLELQIETETFFTLTIAGHSVEVQGDLKRCIELCEAVIQGKCSHTFYRKESFYRSKAEIRRVDTKIVLDEGEPFFYRRQSGLFILGKTTQEEVSYPAY